MNETPEYKEIAMLAFKTYFSEIKYSFGYKILIINGDIIIEQKYSKNINKIEEISKR